MALHWMHRLAAVALCLVASAAWAQSGGPYDLRWNTVDGGGTTFSTGGPYRLGGSVGQADAGTLNGGTFRLDGGFWGASALQATPTATPTVTATLVPNTLTPTASVTATPTLAATPSPSPPNPTPTPTTPVAAPTATTSPTATGVVTPTATPTPTPVVCVGDCNGDTTVAVDDLVTMVNVALNGLPITACEAGDVDDSGTITIEEILMAVTNSLLGCSSPAS